MKSVYLMKERIIPSDYLNTITCFYEFFWIFARPFTSCMCPDTEDLCTWFSPRWVWAPGHSQRDTTAV